MTGAAAAARPLAGIRVVEMEAIGPVPLAGLLLAEAGAEIIRILRPVSEWSDTESGGALLFRGRMPLRLDLKTAEGRAHALDLIAGADAVLEGARPGVMERLGLGPDVCLARNPALVYGRMTGWGQTGPRAAEAGHDINYLALSGTLSLFGTPDKPIAPANLVADFGGGTMMLAFGVVAALLRARQTGEGTVIDAAMIDGVAFLTTVIHALQQSGGWQIGRGRNLLDGGKPYYDTYRCADGGFIAVGAIEERFYRIFMAGIGLDHAAWDRDDPAQTAPLRAAIAERILTRPRDHWSAVFAGTDACVAPVLDLDEARRDAHAGARGLFVDRGGVMGPRATPVFGSPNGSGA